MRKLAILCATALLAACGLGETATSAAVGAKSKAAELEQAREVQRQVVADIEKANDQATRRLEAAESR